jgi:hypothetical protein
MFDLVKYLEAKVVPFYDETLNFNFAKVLKKYHI